MVARNTRRASHRQPRSCRPRKSPARAPGPGAASRASPGTCPGRRSARTETAGGGSARSAGEEQRAESARNRGKETRGGTAQQELRNRALAFTWPSREPLSSLGACRSVGEDHSPDGLTGGPTSAPTQRQVTSFAWARMHRRSRLGKRGRASFLPPEIRTSTGALEPGTSKRRCGSAHAAHPPPRMSQMQIVAPPAVASSPPAGRKHTSSTWAPCGSCSTQLFCRTSQRRTVWSKEPVTKTSEEEGLAAEERT